MLRSQLGHRRLLVAATRVELRKRYAGSVLGGAWLVLYPLLFLGVYLFLWLVVFRVGFPGTGGLDYVVFVFSGLVPFLFLIETLSLGVVSIKQNMHLVKSVIMPVDLLPTRAVGVALAGHLVGLALVLTLCAVNGSLTVRAVFLPLVLAFEMLFLIGVSWFVAPLGVLLPDTAQVISLVSMLLMFLSPISFKPDMVPGFLRVVLLVNPVTYMVAAYRAVLLGRAEVAAGPLAVFAVMAVSVFVLGGAFCHRFKGFVADFQ